MDKRWFVAAACLAALISLPCAAAADNPAALWDTCTNCHADIVRNFAGTPHAASPAGCQGCHGPTDAHVQAGGDPTKVRRFTQLQGPERADVCLGCHQKGNIAQWAGSTHDTRRLDCTTCHDPHPKTARAPEHLLKGSELQVCGACHATQQAKAFRNGHMPLREGKMVCTSCHNPHGTLNEKLLVQHSVNDNCYTCHAEKRGPFLWEHPPVRENCVTCHDPHGSIQRYMLKIKMPLLCQNCHVSSRHPSQTHMASERFSFNQSCLNCHSMIHGSNHPSGNFFLR